MSLFPDKNLFIVTSALKPVVGVISEEDRYKQTLLSLISLRKKFPNDIVFFTDGSPEKIEPEKMAEIKKFCNGVICWAEDEEIAELAGKGMKSQAEVAMLYKMLMVIKTDPEVNHILSQVKRIYKFSARTFLHEDLDPLAHDNHFGKFIFKKRIPTWMNNGPTDHLYITRMYSFCPSLLDDYILALQYIFDRICTFGIDTEHAHHMTIDRKYIVEFDKLHCEGIMANTGETEIY